MHVIEFIDKLKAKNESQNIKNRAKEKEFIGAPARKLPKGRRFG